MRYSELTTVDNIAAAKYNIELWLLDRPQLDFYQGDLLLAPLTSENFAFTVEFGKLIFAYWTDEQANSWRVIAYELEPTALRFHVTAPFKKEVRSFMLCSPGAAVVVEGSRKSARKRYLERLCALIEQNLAGMRVEHGSIGRSDQHGYGAATARFLLRRPEGLMAAVGVSAREDSATVVGLLGQGLNWLAILRSRFAPTPVDRLMLFAPAGRAGVLAERLTLVVLPATGPDQTPKAVSSQAIELFEVDETRSAINPVRPFDQGDLGLRLARSTRLPAAERTKASGSSLQDRLEWIKSLAPALIEIRPSSVRDQLRVEINGLELARAYSGSRPRIEFGFESKQILTSQNQAELVELVEAAAHYRCAGSPAKQHPLYRSAGEAWLEAILRRDIRVLDPNLLPDYLYSQVPAIRQSSERFIDLLGVRADGRLVIIELKVTEEAELPFQGLDYWLRVEWYRARGDFTKRGYFSGVALEDAPALVYLVAPRLRFHKSFTAVVSSIDSRVPVFRIAINDNWREELKVYSRERMN